MKRRVISAIIAAIIAVPLVILGGYPYFAGIGVLAILAYRELINLKKAHNPIPDLVCMFGLICIVIFLIANFQNPTTFGGFSYQAIALCVLLLLVPTVFYDVKKYTVRDAFYLIAAVLFIGLAFNLMIMARSRGLAFFIYLVSIPIITDTFAYIIGSKIGKNKMCPSISPNKSWEGSIAGFISGTIIGVVIYSIWVSKFAFKIVLLSAILSIVGQIGDLVLSKIKRENGIKDFSNIMPGHGGILDRLDSFIFIELTYYLLAFYF